MNNYYLNKNAQSNGDHEVHTESCQFLPSVLNRTFLGAFASCTYAITKAKDLAAFKKINGCIFCSRPCHTS